MASKGRGWLTLLAAVAIASCTRLDAVDRRAISSETLIEIGRRVHRGGPTRATCVGIRPGKEEDAPRIEALTNPSPHVLASVDAALPPALPVSECAYEAADPPFGPTVHTRSGDDAAVVIWVDEVSGRSSIRAGYYAHGLAAAEWTCEARERNGRWLVQCDRIWTS